MVLRTLFLVLAICITYSEASFFGDDFGGDQTEIGFNEPSQQSSLPENFVNMKLRNCGNEEEECDHPCKGKTCTNPNAVCSASIKTVLEFRGESKSELCFDCGQYKWYVFEFGVMRPIEC